MISRLATIVAVASALVGSFAAGASAAQGAGGAAPSAAASASPSEAELKQMLAPLALYPDSLLSQILMASTYPLEIVEADRWSKANPSLEGDALGTALEQQTWDPSVKSLVNFPEVLSSLSENLEWTRKIGDAFLADQKAVLDTVQSLRAEAQAAGNLKSSEQMTVKTEPAPAEPASQIIVIESPSPDVIYVPTYDPAVVYGAWAYPAYPPPVYYRPPGYVAGSLIGFGVGFACGAAWGYGWGNCDWHHGDIDIDVDRNVNFNNNIDRNRYKAEFNKLGADGNRVWNHDAAHRRGVEYHDRSTAQKFNGMDRADAAQAREAFRGRADADRANLARDSAAGRIDPGGIDRSRGADRTPGAGHGRDLDRGVQGHQGRDLNRGAQGPARDADRAGAASRGGTTRAGGGSAHRSSALSDTHQAQGVQRASSRGSASRASAGGRSAGRGGGGGRGGRR